MLKDPGTARGPQVTGANIVFDRDRDAGEWKLSFLLGNESIDLLRPSPDPLPFH